MTDLCETYLKDIPVNVPKDAVPECLPTEYVFSIWLQGEEQAPKIVKSCWNSIRRHSDKELVVLDAKGIRSWIELPPDIWRKWDTGQMKACHFSDLCRVELLWKYGGYWMDATNYMCHPMPEFIVRQPFFLYVGDDAGYSPFVQNCFIRAYAHHPIVGAWKQAIHAYWACHSRAFDYFLPHRLFRHIVLNDGRIAEMFARMPHINHECTHTARWGGYWDKPFDENVFEKLTMEGAFQKLEYKSASSRNPSPGTFADYFVNGGG